jgi:hypothetical protein
MIRRVVLAAIFAATMVLGLAVAPAGAEPPFCIGTFGQPGGGITICTPG